MTAQAALKAFGTNVTTLLPSGEVVWAPVVASGGDKQPAIWQITAVGAAPAFRPTFKLSSQSNAGGTARRMDWSMVYPYVVTDVNGKSTVEAKWSGSGTFLVPGNVPDLTIARAVNAFVPLFYYTATDVNLLETLKSGFAPT